MRFYKRTRGFSLLELLMVLVIASILAALAWPPFAHFLEQKKSEALLSLLTEALEFARQEALVQRVTVTLCKSNDQESCSGEWEEGFIVCRGLALLHAFRVSSAPGHLVWRAFPQDKSYLQFLPSGATNQENGTFWFYPHSAAEPAWAVVISKSGRIRVVTPSLEKGGVFLPALV